MFLPRLSSLISIDITLCSTVSNRIISPPWYSVSMMKYSVIIPLGPSGGPQETTAVVSVCRVQSMLDTGPGAVECKIRRNISRKITGIGIQYY